MNEKYGGNRDTNSIHQPIPQRSAPKRRGGGFGGGFGRGGRGSRGGRGGGFGRGGGGTNNKFATASLVLGIIAAVLCIYATCLSIFGVVAGILALVFAKKAKRQNGGVMPKKAKIGMALGAVGLGILVLTILTAVIYIVLLFSDPNLLEETFSGLESFVQILGFERLFALL